MSEVTRGRIALRLGWLAVFSLGVLAGDQGDDRFWGVFSFASSVVGLAVAVEAYRLGRDWPGGLDRRGTTFAPPIIEPVTGSKWSWLRLVEAYEAVSVGLVIWLATGSLVGVITFVSTGVGGSWRDRAVIVVITAPVAFIWPLRKWPPASDAGFRSGAAAVKRQAALGFLLVLSTFVLASTIDRLVSKFSTLSLLERVGRFATICLIAIGAVWLGRYLRRSSSSVGREGAVGSLSRRIFAPVDYSSGRLTRFEVFLQLDSAGAVIFIAAFALTRVIDALTVRDLASFPVGAYVNIPGFLGGMLWIISRWPWPEEHDEAS